LKQLAIVNLIILSLTTALRPLPLLAQSANSGTQSAPSGNTSSGNTGGSNSGRAPNTQNQSPRFISGQVLSGNGQKITEPVSARLVCGMKTLQAIHAGVDGRFLFTFGLGTQGNTDISAADNSSLPAASVGGLAPIGGAAASLGNGGFNSSVSSFLGCDVSISASGYESVTRPITQSAMLGTVELGVFILRPIAKDEAGAVSVTTLTAPSGARKEFEKAVKDLQQNHKDSAAEHLEKAVSQYDKFAVAWYELGRIYSAGDLSRARRAFEKAIDADAHFVEPYVSLAGLQLDAHDNLAAIQTAARALEVQPRNGLANYIQAAGHFNLNRMAEAESSARLAEETTHGELPELHALLANILLKKEDYPNAVLEMESYLKEAPQGSYAPQIRRNLERLRDAGINSSGEPSPVSETR
jgi:hypothetical protein